MLTTTTGIARGIGLHRKANQPPTTKPGHLQMPTRALTRNFRAVGTRTGTRQHVNVDFNSFLC
jgi:hypothetical protein